MCQYKRYLDRNSNMICREYMSEQFVKTEPTGSAVMGFLLNAKYFEQLGITHSADVRKKGSECIVSR
jgi:hypothetical protein